MHFVGEHAGQKLVRHETQIFSQATGEKIKTLPTIWLTLERGKAPDWAVAVARERFRFATRPTPGSIGGDDISVERWATYVDTEAWAAEHDYDDEIRLQAERVLGSSPDLMVVEPPKLVPPWPNYEQMTIQGSRTADKVAARNIETADEIGVLLDDVIVYEERTLQRDEVLALYRKAVAERAPVEPPAFLVEA